MVRAPPCHGGGHGFESRSGRLIGILAQLGEHLPYKQRVIGSSPIGPIFYFNYHAGVAELADAQDLKSCETNLSYRFDSGRRQRKLQTFVWSFFLSMRNLHNKTINQLFKLCISHIAKNQPLL